MKLNALAKYSWGVLFYNLLVIMWGAYVRATGSGAGCGRHWPVCNGEVIPRAESIETLIEFSHRVTSGFALISVIVLLVWAYRAYAPGHVVRRGAMASMVLMIVEALLGAGLVLFELTADNATVARAFAMALHLINTFLLLAAITLTAWWASGGKEISLRGASARLRWALLAAFLGTIILGASGAVTALGDTLVLTAGMSPADSPLLATLVELRILHPLIGVLVGGLIWLAFAAAQQGFNSPGMTRTGYALLGIYLAQIILGGANVMLKAPVWMQMVHLLVADLIWIALVLMAAQRLAVSATEPIQDRISRTVAQVGD
ncbi:MAG: COX15/CtaA family protein [Caldilineaceae bacterium]|nr:COX15/CtaA family protein [Caldilineaceae bacterium]